MIQLIFLWRVFANLQCCVDNTKNEDCGSHIEGIDDRIGNDPGRCHIADSDGREEEREDIPRKTSGIAEKTLNAVRQSFLLLIHVVAHEHLEWLHGHVDAGVEKHEGDDSENHGSGYRHAEGSCIRQQTHDQHRHQCSDKEIRHAASESVPGSVAE